MTPKRTYLPSINALACSKADIEPVLKNMNISYRSYCGKWGKLLKA